MKPRTHKEITTLAESLAGRMMREVRHEEANIVGLAALAVAENAVKHIARWDQLHPSRKQMADDVCERIFQVGMLLFDLSEGTRPEDPPPSKSEPPIQAPGSSTLQ